MTKFRGSLILVCALTLGGWSCSSGSTRNGGGGGEGGEGGGDEGGKGGSGGKASGGSGGSAGKGGSGGSAGSGGGAGSGEGGSGGATGGSGGSTGGSGGATGGSGGGGSGGSPADAGSDGPPASGGKFTITVDGVMMGDRLCFKKEASASGGNHSPKIEWMNPPAGTMSYVLTMYDQTNMTPHRIVCNIPATETGQAADIGNMLPMGAEDSTGHNKTGDPWYGPGADDVHSYEIRIWALATAKLEGGCSMSGAAPTRAVYQKLKTAPATLVLGSDFKILWGNKNGDCR